MNFLLIIKDDKANKLEFSGNFFRAAQAENRKIKTPSNIQNTEDISV